MQAINIVKLILAIQRQQLNIRGTYYNR